MEERISMLKRTMLIMAGVFAAVVSDARAQTTPPPATLGFVNINFGAQPGTRDIGRSASFPVYGEDATLVTDQENGGGAMFDITGGYRFRGNWAGAIGFSNFQNHTDSGAVVTVPHPLLFNAPRTINTSVADLSHSERGIHLSAVWFYPITNEIDLAFSAGPSFIRVKQELVSSVTIPPGTQDANFNVESESKTAFGVNLGVDGSYLITKNFGAGVFVRYAGGKVDLPSAEDLRVGGFQAGVGARLRF
jgi:hypothetical protein